MSQHIDFMRLAIDLANENIQKGGGPFGAILVKDGKVVGKGVNQVTNQNDPTAHAEVLAIREACKHLQTFNLSSCVLYTTCEPCPMCLGAIYWARIPEVYYGNNREDAAKIGFDDDFIYEEISASLENRSILMSSVLSNEAFETFRIWEKMPNKTKY